MIEAGRYRHLIVTGGRGYIGRALVEVAVAAGYRVTALSRGGGGALAGVRHVAWQLGERLPFDALDPTLPPDAQAFVHLAHDWCDVNLDASINLAGTRILRDDCRRLGFGRVVFVSSQSARPDALNRYGRIKWRIEQLFDAPNEISLRVGLVYGGPQMGQYGLLSHMVMRTSVLPMIAAHQPVQPIHRSEVAQGILLAIGGSAAGAIGLAGPQPIPFSLFLDTLARLLRGGRILLIPVPLGLALRLCDVANALPLVPHIDRERILGLAGTRATETAADLEHLGLKVMPFAEGMLVEPRTRRALLAEGRALLRYILRRAPGHSLVRRYARAIAVAGPVGAMRLNRAFALAPWLLRFVEPFHAGSTLAHRLKVATALVECSPEGVAVLRRGGRAGRLGGLICDGFIEILAMPVRLLATALWR